jgi:hypothetical protein
MQAGGQAPVQVSAPVSPATGRHTQHPGQTTATSHSVLEPAPPATHWRTRPALSRTTASIPLGLQPLRLLRGEPAAGAAAGRSPPETAPGSARRRRRRSQCQAAGGGPRSASLPQRVLSRGRRTMCALRYSCSLPFVCTTPWPAGSDRLRTACPGRRVTQLERSAHAQPHKHCMRRAALL